ncbi:MAG: hypothetical protein VB859_04440 [Planctomycetaceae bacterium]
MNCLDALQRLDVARPDGSDLDQPEFRDARVHLERCPACANEFSRRNAWDRDFLTASESAAESTSLFSVPDGLATRVVASLTSAENRPAVEPEATRPLSRRGWLTILATTALVACVAVVWKSTLVAAGPLTVDRIRNWPDELFDSVDDAEALAALPEFIESGIPLPTGWDPAWLDQPIRSWPERTAVAVMSFQVPLSRRDRVKGLLLAVPVGNVLDRPTANDMTAARPDYSRSGRFSTAAWTDAESGMVFVCLIAPGQYERLRRALVPQPV